MECDRDRPGNRNDTAWADSAPAGAAVTLWLGAMTVIYGSWAVVSRDTASKHSPLLVIALSLAVVPWLGGFAGDAAAWISWIAGLALLVIVSVHMPTVRQLVPRMSRTRHPKVVAKEHACAGVYATPLAQPATAAQLGSSVAR